MLNDKKKIKQTFSNNKMATQTLLAIMKTYFYRDIKEIQLAKVLPEVSTKISQIFY